MITDIAIEDAKVTLQGIKAGQMFKYRNCKFIRDNMGYFVNLTCGKRVGLIDFPHSYETLVTPIISCFCSRS